MLSSNRPLSPLLLVNALLMLGCSSQTPLGRWEGPERPADVRRQDWHAGPEMGQVLLTEHYRIFTTVTDQDVLQLLPQVMEGAWARYRLVAPHLQPSDQPLDCYMFRWRGQWEAYTERYAGPNAKVYLKIRSGGYTIQDRYVTYYNGREGAFSVASHEGWHQFIGRHFKGRLPPFIEEGLACMFEAVSWDDRLPRWNISLNGPRAQALRRTIAAKSLLPLQDLCAMQAGQTVGRSGDEIDRFYAQSWAFARFLWDAEDRRFRPALQRWLADAADGAVHDPTGSHRQTSATWQSQAVRPMLEHYLGADISTLDMAYRAFARKIAYDELPKHRSAS